MSYGLVNRTISHRKEVSILLSLLTFRCTTMAWSCLLCPFASEVRSERLVVASGLDSKGVATCRRTWPQSLFSTSFNNKML